jgi:hypothetical protein
MKKLKTEDPEVVNFKTDLEKLYALAGFSLKDEATSLGEASAMIQQATSLFEVIKSAEGDNSESIMYRSGMSDFITSATKIKDEFTKKLEKLNAIHLECCTFFLVPKGDEKLTDTEEFFKFFT